MKPPGWIMCPNCFGTTYVYENVENPTGTGASAKMTNQKCDRCTQGYTELK